MRGKWILLAGTIVFLAVAAGALSVYRRGANAKAQKPAPAAQAAPAPTHLSLQGAIQAQHVVNIPAPLEGTIESFGAEVGEDVVEGQLIAQVRNQKLDSALEAATAELQTAQDRVTNLEGALVAARLEASRASADASRARSDFDRAEKVFQRQQVLIREGATPRLVFEKAQKDYIAAKEEFEGKDHLATQAEERVEQLARDLDTAKKRLEERTEAAEDAKAEISAGDVRAPVDGIILSRRGSPGEQVDRTMQDFIRIAVTLSALEVAVQPDPASLPRIKPGQTALVYVAENQNEAIPGTVREIQDGRAIVDFTSPTPIIRPGLTAQVRIQLQ